MTGYGKPLSTHAWRTARLVNPIGAFSISSSGTSQRNYQLFLKRSLLPPQRKHLQYGWLDTPSLTMRSTTGQDITEPQSKLKTARAQQRRVSGTFCPTPKLSRFA